ncbi:hypothetical protein AN1V17_15830 [Vallitalea sediminicola]
MVVKIIRLTNLVLSFYNAVEKEAFSDEYIVSKEPLFTGNDINYYDWSTHTIVFKDDFISQQKNIDKDIKIGGSSIFDTNSRDKFMVYVDNELLYDGYYNQSLLSSFYPIGAVLFDLSDAVRIDFNGIKGVELKDNRSDLKMYESLKLCKILND